MHRFIGAYQVVNPLIQTVGVMVMNILMHIEDSYSHSLFVV